jgi:hypothetical protein
MVIGAFFDPKAFAPREPVTVDAGFAAGLAAVCVAAGLVERGVAAADFGTAFVDVFVCAREDEPVIAATATTKRKIPIRLVGSGFTRYSPWVFVTRVF